MKKITADPDLPLSELPSFDGCLTPGATAGVRTRPAYAAPTTAVEARIAEIWQELFGIEYIGVHEQFTDLGGHSLMAIKLVSALQEEFDIDIKPVAMFEFPTIAQLADFIPTSEAT